MSETISTDTKSSMKPEITETNDEIDKSPPREALITTAMHFLKNPKIRNSSIFQKREFLLSKGLSSKEIQTACQRLGIFYPDNSNTTVVDMESSATPPNLPPPISMERRLQPQQSQDINPFRKIKEILNSVALFGGITYAIYYLYKNYIEPFLFGTKKKKAIDERLLEIDNELSDIKETINLNSQQQTQMMNIEFSNFKSDLEAIKGLLLNRKQFANPLTSAVPPSIPAWQLSSTAPHRRNSHSDNEKNASDDAGSGSGSSETEVVTKNSDSSLEIM